MIQHENQPIYTVENFHEINEIALQGTFDEQDMPDRTENLELSPDVRAEKHIAAIGQAAIGQAAIGQAVMGAERLKKSSSELEEHRRQAKEEFEERTRRQEEGKNN